MSAAVRPVRLAGLDALRGIAALVVVIGHVFLARDGAEHGRPWIAVDVFFALSGYVTARTYEARLGRDLSAGGFLAARLRRLWPVMAVGALLGFVLLGHGRWPLLVLTLI